MSPRARLSIAAAAIAAVVAATVAIPFPAAAQPRPPAPGARLTDAYKREVAFLESEKAALERRLAEDRKAADARKASARAEISALQGRVVSAASEAERLEQLLLDAERKLDAVEQSEDVGEDLVARAETAFSRAGVKLPEAATTADGKPDPARQLEQLGFIFERAPAVLARQAEVRIEAGGYFDVNGARVEGPILHVGAIASFGLVDGAVGPLAPAGEERLKLWPTPGAAEAATRLREGKATATLPLFLYESLEKGAERKAGKTLAQIMEAGGPVGWVIVSLGLAAALMMLARAGLLAWASRGGRRLLRPVLAALSRGDVEAARALAARARNPAGRVLGATLASLDRPREQLEDRVAEAVLHEQPHLARFGSAILVLAAVAPLLGLLGTVTGMIATFDIITEFGTGNPKLLSGGISEALVTTELGLVVAIPALLVGHVLNGWAERIRDSLDAAALAAVNRAAGLEPPDDAPRPARTTDGEPVTYPATREAAA